MKAFCLHLAVIFWMASGAVARQSGAAPASGQSANAAGIQQAIGSIKSIDDNGLILTSDAGEEYRITISDTAKILRVAPGQKDLKTATPLQKSDLQVGDRILVRGRVASEPRTLTAAAIVAMKQSDVSAKQDKDREDWQKRGVGGLVTAVDAATGTITISQTSFTGTKSIAVHTTKSTILRRYPPNSVKFDDAKVASLDQVKAGDQLRARGAKNADGTEITADDVG